MTKKIYWNRSTAGLKEALDEWGEVWPENCLHVHDVLRRRCQRGMVQLDIAFSEKFQLEYKNSEPYYPTYDSPREL